MAMRAKLELDISLLNLTFVLLSQSFKATLEEGDSVAWRGKKAAVIMNFSFLFSSNL